MVAHGNVSHAKAFFTQRDIGLGSTPRDPSGAGTAHKPPNLARTLLPIRSGVARLGHGSTRSLHVVKVSRLPPANSAARNKRVFNR